MLPKDRGWSRIHRPTTLYAAAAAAKSLQSCLTLCDPIDGSPPGSTIPGMLQARTLERVGVSLSNAWKWKVKVKLLIHVWLIAAPWTAAYQAPPSMGFFRQQYWRGVPLPNTRTPQLPSVDKQFKTPVCLGHGVLLSKSKRTNYWYIGHLVSK